MNKLKAINVYIGDKIRSYRELLEINQDELAVRSGLTRPTIVNIEQGRNATKAEILMRFCVLFDCEISQIFPPKEWFEKYEKMKVERIVTYRIVED